MITRLLWYPEDFGAVDVEDRIRRHAIREAEHMATLDESSRIVRVSGKTQPSDGIPIKGIVERTKA